MYDNVSIIDLWEEKILYFKVPSTCNVSSIDLQDEDFGQT